jgi:hypothetical protein
MDYGYGNTMVNRHRRAESKDLKPGSYLRRSTRLDIPAASLGDIPCQNDGPETQFRRRYAELYRRLDHRASFNLSGFAIYDGNGRRYSGGA